MKKLFTALILCATLSAQTKFSDGPTYPPLLYANLPSAAASDGKHFRVTDCLTSACTAGGGSTKMDVASNGSAWVVIGSGGVPAGSTNDLQTNAGGGVFGAITPATGMGTFLATPSSANLNFALTTKSGSGLALFNSGGTIDTSLSHGTAYISETKQAGTTGTTASLLVKYDSSGNVVTAATTEVASIGIAVSTATLSTPVEVVMSGIAPCIADNTTVIGHFAISGTSTAGRCRDSGTADPTTIATSVQIVGIFRSVATVGNAASMEVFGPGHFGGQVTGGGSVTAVSWTGGLVSIANPTTTPAFTLAGSSGGIPYFDSTSSWASSGALAANRVVLGGGAGAAPTVAAADTTTTHAFFATAGAPAFRAMVAGDLPGAGAFTGDVSGTFPATTVIKINGVTMSGLATGIVKNTTGTGAPSIAVAGDFPTLNQNTSGTAATITGLLGSGNIPKIDVLDASAFAADAGSTDTYAATLSPAITAYVTGTHYRFKANTINTGAASVNFNAVGAKTIVKVAGGVATTLADGDIRAGQWVDLVYDGTNMQMQSTLGNAGSGGAGTPCTITGLSFQYNNAGAFGCVGTWTTNGTDVTVGASTIDLSAATVLLPNSAISTAYLNGLYSQLAAANVHTAGTLNSFSHDATLPGFRLVPQAGNPSTLSDGACWYNSTTPALNCRVNGVTVAWGTATSAATLTTPRAIYGNNFDGSAALTQIIASTFGGTGNGFAKFSGPATSEKTFTLPNASSTLTITVASGAKALSTSALASATCRDETDTATGAASTDAITASFNASTTAVTGYTGATAGGLSIRHFPSTNLVTFQICNATASSITPGAITMNWRITR